MTNRILIIIIGIILVLGVGILAIRFLTGEDVWLCQKGEWVKHGVPSAPMPTTLCPGANINNSNQVENQISSNIPEELLPYKDSLEKDLANFFDSWSKYEPGVSLNSFTKSGEGEIDGETYPYTPNILREKIIGVFSPDQKKYVDPVIYTEVFFHENGEIDFASDVDSGVNLIDLEKKTIKNILSCGTPCGWYNAYWLTDSIFIVTGRGEAYPGGYDKCMNDNTCTEVITLDLFDLEKNKRYNFQSKGIEQAKYFAPENMPIKSYDPFEEDRKKYEALLAQGIDLRPDVLLENLHMFDTIVSPLNITGRARGNWYFEASFPIKLLNADGKEIAMTTAQAQSDWMTTDYVPFKATLKFTVDKEQGGTLVFMNDNPSGLPENDKKFELPISLKAEEMTVKVFFSEMKRNNYQDCSIVYPYERKIFKTPKVAMATLEELIKGPTEEENTQGIYTTISNVVKVQKLTIVDGVARVDFNSALDPGGGSCAVAAVRAQVIQTLKQFASVKEVIISIDGRTEDILQP